VLAVDGPLPKKTKENETSTENNLLEDEANENTLPHESIKDGHFLPVDLTANSFSSSENIEFFENQSLKLVIQKSHYQRGTRFSHLDSLFNVKILPKADLQNPLYIKDLLEILDKGLKYILEKLQSFFPNTLSFLTLYQDGMTNGLSTGGYKST